MTERDAMAGPQIHAIWLGSEPPPELMAGLAALRSLNPDHEVRLWRDGDLDWLVNRDLFDTAPSFAAKANLARYEIVHRHGGFYVDADFEWLRPLDPQHFPTDRLVVGPVNASLLNNGLFGAPAGHPFLARLIHNVRASIAGNPGGISQVVSGPSFFTTQFQAWRDETGGDCYEVPRDLVYPYFVDKCERDKGPWSPKVIGIHHWSQGRSRRAVSRLREAGLDAARKAGLRRATRFAKSARLADVAVDERPVQRFLLRVLEGSDTYIEVGSPTFSEWALGLLGTSGRVFSLDPRRPAGTGLAIAPADGPADHELGTPADLAHGLDVLSHVRVLQVHADEAEQGLRDASPLVLSGRMDFILVPAEALGSGTVARWVEHGATTHGLSGAGGLTRVPRAPNTIAAHDGGTPTAWAATDARGAPTRWCVVDARPIRSALLAGAAAGGAGWRLPDAYRPRDRATTAGPAVSGAECPACGGAVAAAQDYAGFAMVVCPACTYLGTRDRSFPASAYAEVYEDNEAYLERIHHARATAASPDPSASLDRFKRKALAWAGEGGTGSLLDVGCGPGAFLLGAQSLGWRVEGVEPAPTAASTANELGVPTFTGTLDDAGAPTGPFDAITAFEVLEHVGDPVGLLRSMAAVLAPAGRIVMSMPNLDDANLLSQTNPEDVPPIHVSFFNRRSLAAASARAGLRVERVYTHPVAVASLRLVYGAGWKYRLPREAVRAVLGRTDGSPMLVMLRKG